jgi:DNA-binding CsgD family transcriptional regulator
MYELLTTLEEHLIQAQSVDACDQALHWFLNQNGIQTFSFTYYSYHPHSASKLKYNMCSDNFQNWHQHYIEEEYNYIDSTLQFVYQNHLPIYWNLKQLLAQAQNEEEKQMRLDSIAFGAEAGLSIPVHGPHNNFAILLLVEMKGESINIQKPFWQHIFFTTAHLYYHYLKMHLLDELSESKTYQLTQREIQCLSLIARELSVKEMAQHLEITERTVNFHIQKMNKKLGTKNKYQSLNKAIVLKLLTL